MKTILCYGDSNLRGFLPGSFNEKTGLSERIPKTKRWTGILQRKLGDSYDVIEEGLNGRTTNLDELPSGRPYRNGLKHLPLILESHFPIDLVITNLGGNDTKTQFNRTAKDITEGMKQLVQCIKTSRRGPSGTVPKVLIIAPPPILEIALAQDPLFDANSCKTSRELPALYKQLAKEMACEFLDSSLVAKASEVDGVHFDEPNCSLLGDAVAKKVMQIYK